MWTYNNTRIFVTNYDEQSKAIRARLQPLSSGTIIHHFGYESPIITLECKVVSTTNKDAISNLRKNNVSYTLSGHEGVIGNFFLDGIKAKISPFATQSLDLAQARTTTVWDLTLELSQDV